MSQLLLITDFDLPPGQVQSFLSTTFYFSFLVVFFRFVLFFIFMLVVVGCCYCCISWRARTSKFTTTKADFISKQNDYPYTLLTFYIVDDWHESSRDRKMTPLICRQNLNLFWSRCRFSENSNYLCLWGHAVRAACRSCNSTIFLSLNWLKPTLFIIMFHLRLWLPKLPLQFCSTQGSSTPSFFWGIRQLPFSSDPI